MGMEKVGFVRRIVRKIFSLKPFKINIGGALLDPLDVIMTIYGERVVMLWACGESEITVVPMPRFKSIVGEQIWMAKLTYLLRYKLI